MQTGWRDLSEPESRSWDKARMGGALLAIAIATGLLSLALLVILLMFGASLAMHGIEAAIRALVVNTGDRHVRMAFVASSSTVVLLVGSVIVFAMILLRASATPVIAAAGAILLFSMNIATMIATQWIAFDGRLDLVWAVALSAAPQWIGGFAMTAGFVGYMLGGARPNAYFRRRVAVPDDATLEGVVA